MGGYLIQSFSGLEFGDSITDLDPIDLPVITLFCVYSMADFHTSISVKDLENND